MNTEKRVLRGNSKDSILVDINITLIMKMYLTSSLVAVDRNSREAIDNSISSLTSEDKDISNNSSSSLKKIYLKTQMSYSLIFSKFSNSTEERKFG